MSCKKDCVDECGIDMIHCSIWKRRVREEKQELKKEKIGKVVMNRFVKVFEEHTGHECKLNEDDLRKFIEDVIKILNK